MATQKFKISKVNVDLSKYTLTSSIANDYTRNDELEENWYTKEYVAGNYTANAIVADNYYSKDYVNTNYKSNTDVDSNYFTKTYVATNYYLKNDIDTIQLNIKNAINNKGGTLTNEPFSSYATAINNLTISSGGGSSESSDSLDAFLQSTTSSFTYNGTSIARACQLYASAANDTSSPVINMPNLTELPAYTSSSTAAFSYFPYNGTLNAPNLTELPNYFSNRLFNIYSTSVGSSVYTAFNKLDSFLTNKTKLGTYALYYAISGNTVSANSENYIDRSLVLNLPSITSIGAYALSYCGVRQSYKNPSGPYQGMNTNGFKISMRYYNDVLQTSYALNGLLCGILYAPNMKLWITTSSSNVFGSASSTASSGNSYTHTIDINKLFYTSGSYRGSYYVFGGWNNLQTLVIRGDEAPYTGFVASSSDSSQRIFNQYCYCMLGTVNSNYNPNGVKGRIYVNDNQVDAYKSAPGWSEFADQIYPLSKYDEATRYDDIDDSGDVEETYTYTDDSYIVLKTANGGYVNTNYIPSDMENTKIELKFEYVDYVYGYNGLFGSKYYSTNSAERTYNGVYYETTDPTNGLATVRTGKAGCISEDISSYITANTPNILTIIGGYAPYLNDNALIPTQTYTNYQIKYPLGIGAILGTKTSDDESSGTIRAISSNNGSLKFYYMKIYTREDENSAWVLTKDYRPRVGRGIVETINDTTLYNLNNETPLDQSYYNGGFGNV